MLDVLCEQMAEFLSLRNRDFVHAARAAGLRLPSILFRHMLPNGMTPVIVNASFGVASAILIESTLSFLGIGDKEVAVPFSSLHVKRKDNSWYLAMNTTKDALKGTPNFAYAGERARW